MEGEGRRSSVGGSSGEESSLWSKARKKCAIFFTSLRESLQYVRASVIGRVKKAKARDEKEATRAEMEAEKMQVDAANAAEAKKKKHRLGMT